MPTEKLHAPQLITNARMLYLVWVPSEPKAVETLVPKELTPAADRAVFMNQYIVDRAEQTSNAGHESGFGQYSLTYLGADLAGLDAGGGVPGRWWTHYFNSSPNMIEYAKDHGVPATSGTTTLDLSADKLVATTLIDGKAVIRATCKVAVGKGSHANGQLRYITRVGGKLMSGRYPFVMTAAETFSVESLEFLDSSHPVNALRPQLPLRVTFGFYSPAISFCYPGGEGPLGEAPNGV